MRDAAQAECHTAAGDNAFLDCSAGCVHGIFDASLLLFHFRLGRSANLDYSDATNQLRQPLLQLLAVIVAGCFFDLATNFLYPALNVSGLAFAFDNRCIVFVDGNLLGLAEVADLNVFQLDAEILSDGLPPVSFAMSSSMALRRSPKPGALTAATCSVPRSLFTTRVPALRLQHPRR